MKELVSSARTPMWCWNGGCRRKCTHCHVLARRKASLTRRKEAHSAEENRNARCKKEGERISKTISRHDSHSYLLLWMGVQRSVLSWLKKFIKWFCLFLTHLSAVFDQYFVTLQNKDLKLYIPNKLYAKEYFQKPKGQRRECSIKSGNTPRYSIEKPM